MSGLFGSAKPKSNSYQVPVLTGMNLQTSAYGVPIAIVFGQTRISCNLIFYGGFNAVPQNSPSSGNSGGGKGGITGGGGKGGGSQTTSYLYYADIMMGLCEGPIGTTGNVWSSQTMSNAPGLNIGIFFGSLGQAGWSFLQANYASQYSNYSGIAYGAAEQFPLGAQGQMPNLSFEVAGFYAGGLGGADAEAALIPPRLLTDGQFGIGFPANRVGTILNNSESHAIPGSGPYQITVTNSSGFLFNLSVQFANGTLMKCVPGSPAQGQYSFGSGVYTFNSADGTKAVQISYASLTSTLNQMRQYTNALGLFVSPAYTQAQQASAILDDFAKYLNFGWVWSSGVLTAVPYGTVTVSGNGYTWNAPNAPLFNLTDDDFMPNKNPIGTSAASMNDDPVILTRSRTADQMNTVQVEYVDRSNQYAVSIAEANDQGLIDKFGRRTTGAQAAHFFTTASAADTSAQLLLQREYVRNSYSFQLDMRYCVLDPMDVVALNDTNLGLVEQWVRIDEIQENDDGTLSFAAEEYPTGTGVPATYSLNSGSGYIPNYGTVPNNAAAPIFVEPAPNLTDTGLEVWMGACGGANNPQWGGAQVWVSTDGNTYKLFKNAMPARMGVTSSTFPAGSDPDTVHTLGVDLTQSNGALDSGTQADADNGVTLCVVDQEMIAYQTATLTAANKYNIGTYIRRGQYGTAIAAHSVGAPFLRLDQNVVKVPYDKTQIGQTIYVKLVSFNVFDGGFQSLASVPAYTHTIQGPPLPGVIQQFAARQNGGAVVLTWNDLADFGSLHGYDIGYAPQGTYGPFDQAKFTLLTEVSRMTEMTTLAIPPGTWTLAIWGHTIADQLGPMSFVNLVVQNVNNLIYEADEAPDWTGTLTNFLKHWTGVLVPDSTKPANQHTNAELFEQFCPFPVASASYATNAIDTGVDTSNRVYATETVTTTRGVTGLPIANLAIDTWLTGQSDPNTFTPWTIGQVTMRYLRAMLTETVGAVPAVVAHFSPTVDDPLQTTTAANLTAAPGGTAFNYAALGMGPFHTIPQVVATPVGSGVTSASITNPTKTGFTLHVWTGTSDSGGNANVTVTGD